MKKKSFTLVEILISTFILGFLLSGIISVINVGDRVWRGDMTMVELQQQVRWTMRGLVTEIRQSNLENVTITNIGASSDRIDFFVPDSPNTISYYLNGTQVIREHPTGITRVIMDDVTGLQFFCCTGVACDAVCVDDEVVEVRIQATKTFRGETMPTPVLKERIQARN